MISSFCLLNCLPASYSSTILFLKRKNKLTELISFLLECLDQNSQIQSAHGMRFYNKFINFIFTIEFFAFFVVYWTLCNFHLYQTIEISNIPKKTIEISTWTKGKEKKGWDSFGNLILDGECIEYNWNCK